MGGVGACSPRKILKFRPCESASEARLETTTIFVGTGTGV